MCHAPTWNKWFCGSRRDGKIYEISPTVYTDDGDSIRTLRRTSHVDHGTMTRKFCHRLDIKLKRGIGILVGTPYLTVRWRDNGSSVWKNDHQIKVSLGKIGETGLIGHLNRLGNYRTRQYEFILTDAVPLTLVDAEEEIGNIKSD